MITYRSVVAADWSEIIDLTNQIFKEKIPMEKSFPLLFDLSNTFSYVALDRDKIIGFIGVLPEELKSYGQTYYGSRIGAVCIANDYQGRGIGRSLFRLMKKEASNDFILISGQGKLYVQEGGEFFGEFKEFVIPAKEGPLKITEYKDKLNQLISIHQLLEGKENYFVKSLSQLQKLIKAHSLANLWQGQQKIYLVYQAEEIQGVLITCTRVWHNQKLTEVLEYGGIEELLVLALQQVALETPNLTIRLPKENQLAQLLKKITVGNIVQNSGTCLFLNNDIRAIEIPHTWDLAFL